MLKDPDLRLPDCLASAGSHSAVTENKIEVNERSSELTRTLLGASAFLTAMCRFSLSMT